MSSRIDPYIGLHFRDREEAAASTEAVIVTRSTPSAMARTSRGLGPASIGLEVFERHGSVGEKGQQIYSAQVPFEAARFVKASEDIESIEWTAPAPKVAVLVCLGDASWSREIPGFDRGSRLGPVLTGRATREAIEALSEDPAVLSIEASRTTHGFECVASMPFIGATAVHTAVIPEKGDRALVAIVDSGIDVLHHAFRNGAGTRIVAIWDQRSTVGPTPRAAAVAGNTAGARFEQDYGRYHSRADIDGYLLAHNVPADLGRDPDAHGTHVASTAAGSPYVSAGSTDPAADGQTFPGGVAPASGIVLVIPDLNSAPGDPVSLGYSTSHVDALAFIKETARAVGMPVAVNVSLGMNAGAHDGTSLLELAFDEFSGGGREPGYVIIKSAGNEQQHPIHAEATAANGASAAIEWVTNTTPRREDYLEFWFASSDELEFAIRFNAAAPAVRVDRAEPVASAVINETARCNLQLDRFHHDNGDARLMVVTRGLGGSALNVAGTWRLEIYGKRVVSGGRVSGWIERSPKRPARFTTGALAAETLSIPGTARTVISVGACDLGIPPAVQSFSSRGPSRDGREKPELVAPGHSILAAEAGADLGLLSMGGTSMAAPHVTGAVALVLSARAKQAGARQLNAAQIQSALSQCLGGFTGDWSAGGGYGWLDVGVVLNAFR